MPSSGGAPTSIDALEAADVAASAGLWRGVLGTARTLVRGSWLNETLTIGTGVVFAASGLASAQDPSTWQFGSAVPLFWVGVGLSSVVGVAAIWRARLRKADRSETEAVTSERDGLRTDLQAARGEVTDLQSAVAFAEGEAAALRSALHNEADRVLKALADDFGFTENERISLYVVRHRKLRLVARHSADLVYREVSVENRSREFELDHGLIGNVAQTGKRVKRGDGPEPDRATARYRKWHAKNLKLKVSDDLKELNMKSRTYDVSSIDRDGERRAVLCLESLTGDEQRVFDLGDAVESGGTSAEHVGALVELLANAPGGSVWRVGDE